MRLDRVLTAAASHVVAMRASQSADLVAKAQIGSNGQMIKNFHPSTVRYGAIRNPPNQTADNDAGHDGQQTEQHRLP